MGKKPKKAKKAKARKQKNDQILKSAGCLTPEMLSAKVLKAINQLDENDVAALKRISRAVDLGVFFKGRGPQEGGNG